MGTPRLGHALFLLPNGNVLAVGGKSTISGSPLTSTEIFNTSANTWDAGPTMAQGTGATAQLTDGRILRVYPNGAAETNYSGSSWNPIGNLNTPRANPTVAALPGGRALVLGGYGTGGSTDGAKRMEVYDPTSTGLSSDTGNNWTLGKQMYDARAGASARILPDGTLLVYGGTAGTATDTHPVLTTETIDMKTYTAAKVTPTQDDAIGPVTAKMANADILSIGFREPGTNQTHHSLRYAAPATQPLLAVTPSLMQFGSKAVGSTTYGIATVLNYGGSPVTIGNVQLQGFGTVVIDYGNSCANQTVQPGKTCSLAVGFKPAAGIPYSASIAIASNATGGTLTIPV